jgi:hypothetical protein
MNEDLWAGVHLKAEYAKFFLQKMSDTLQPPRFSNAIVLWEQSFYPNLDAFLAMARSIPEIIQCCFGKDGSHKMKRWFNALSHGEQLRRKEFANNFCASYKVFSDHALSTARNISFHRTGHPPVEVRITGRFGVTHVGDPVKRVPMAESRDFGDPGDNHALLWAATQPPFPVLPMWRDFTIGGKPLFAECKDYLELAEELVAEARVLSERVHGTEILTSPS